MASTIPSTETGSRASAPHIILGRMHQQAQVRTAKDDWTGQSSQAERRRRQNRINQRAYRKRCKEAQLQATFTPDIPPEYPIYARSESLQITGEVPNSAHATRRLKSLSYSNGLDADPQETGPWQTFSSAITSKEPKISELTHVAVTCKSDPSDYKTLVQYKKWVSTQRRKPNSPNPAADNILVLIKFNVFRALTSNCQILGFPIEISMDDNAMSPFAPLSMTYPPFSGHNPSSSPGSSSGSSPPNASSNVVLPGALLPTTLQRLIPHHPWIDLLPFPAIRDNLILAEDSYDDYALCEDLCGFHNSPKSGIGLIVWGEPWDITAWEVTPSFARKWGWVLRGVGELMEGTNRWRGKRGERELNWGRLEEVD